MKVLHCIPGMGGGGAERQLAYLARPLTESGWQVHVALGSGGPNLDRLQAGGAVVHRLTGGSHDPRLAWQLAQVVRRVRPDIVQAWFVQMQVLGGVVAQSMGTPWVMTERSSEGAYPPSLKNRLRRIVARTADAIVANSEAGAAYWQQRAPSVPRFVIPNALPIEEIDAAHIERSTLPFKPGSSVILYAGRLAPEKNVATLIKALEAVVTRPDTVAVICGDGPDRPAIERMIAAARLSDRIVLPGYVEDLWPLMKRADLVVSLSLFEGHPNAILEAMACARPIVLSDIPAHRRVLDEECAYFVDPTNVAGIASTLNRALNDSAESARRAAAARGRSVQWTIRDAADEYDRVYRAVLSQRVEKARVRASA